MADDVDWIWYGPPVIPWTGRHEGRGGVARFFAVVGESADVDVYEPREFLPGAGGVVTVLGWQRVRARPTGKTWETHFAHVFTVIDGKLARAREFYDTVPIAAAFTP
jgi:ketosteroid isomerase-like protein